jgi:hypothetical protein
MRRQKCFTHDSIEFMSRILANSGTSQSTAWPPSILKCLQDGSPPSDRYVYVHIYCIHVHIYPVHCDTYRYTVHTICTPYMRKIHSSDAVYKCCTVLYERRAQRSCAAVIQYVYCMCCTVSSHSYATVT